MKNFESSSIVVQWDTVANVTNYTVMWTNDANPIHSTTLIEQSSYTITGLTLDTVYTITVTAANRFCTGPEVMTSVVFSAGTYHINTNSNDPVIVIVGHCILSYLHSNQCKWNLSPWDQLILM